MFFGIIHCLVDLLHGELVQGVEFIGAINGDGEDTVFGFSKEVLEVHRFYFFFARIFFIFSQ